MNVSISLIFFSLNIYNELVFTLTIVASAFSFCEAVITDNPKCLDFVYNPWRIFEYLMNVLSSAKSSIINRTEKVFHFHFLLVFYHLVLCVNDV